VLIYISLGEDRFTYAGQAARVGDGRGPAFFDRELGQVVYENRGVASYYLDEWNSLGSASEDRSNKYPDGLADRHGTWGGCYVNAGDTAWQRIVLDEAARIASLGIDGYFMDTPETPDPWQGYGWTAEGMHRMIERLDAQFPDMLLLLNRGIFFFDPNNAYQYRWNPIDHIDLALFESYFLDSNYPVELGGDGTVSYSPYFLLNKFYTGPKFHAALGRKGHAIPVINIDYANTPDQLATDRAALWARLLDETIGRLGRLELVTDRLLATIPTAVLDHPATADKAPPAWQNSTMGKKELLPGQGFFDVVGLDYILPVEPSSYADSIRAGVQKAVPGDGEVIVQWDVAVDQSGPIRYNLYRSSSLPFDFATATLVADADYVPSPDYTARGFLSSDDATPFEYRVSGLANGTPYYFAVRAEDRTSGVASPSGGRIGPGGGIEEMNARVVAAVPQASGTTFALAMDGAFADWVAVPKIADAVGDVVSGTDFIQAALADSSAALFFYFKSAGNFGLADLALFLNTDGHSYTGDPAAGGADAKFVGGLLYRWIGSGSAGSWTEITGSGEAYGQVGTEFELRLPKVAIGAEGRGVLRWAVQASSSGDRLPDAGFPGLSYRPLNAPTDLAGPAFVNATLVATDLAIDGAVRLTWRPATDPNGPVTYEVLTGTGGAVRLAPDGRSYSGIADTTFAITGLTNGFSANFVVRARDGLDNTSESAPAAATPTLDAVPPVWSGARGLRTAEAGDSWVRLHFGRATDAAHPPTRYTVHYYRVGQPADSTVLTDLTLDTTAQPGSVHSLQVRGLSTGQGYSFRVRAEDRLGNRDTNTVRLTATPAAPDTLAVATMDGFFGDWANDPAVIHLGTDPAGDQPAVASLLDLRDAWVALRGNFLFIRYQVAAAVTTLDWHQSLYLDLDNEPTTGYSGTLGIEGLLQGGGLLYSLPTGTAWSPTRLADATVRVGQQDSTQVELAIPLSAFGNPSGLGDSLALLLQFGAWPDYDEMGPFRLGVSGGQLVGPSSAAGSSVVAGSSAQGVSSSSQMSLSSSGSTPINGAIVGWMATPELRQLPDRPGACFRTYSNGQARLELLTLDGRLIRSAELSAGPRETSWTGVTPGRYVVRLMGFQYMRAEPIAVR
jgi:hypothetical protein